MRPLISNNVEFSKINAIVEQVNATENNAKKESLLTGKTEATTPDAPIRENSVIAS